MSGGLPSHVLDLLKCSVCNNSLSYFPINIKNNENICGRCNVFGFTDEDEPSVVIRNIAYENIASTVDFPCKNQGCEKLFRPKDIVKHENCCAYTPIKCPLSCNSMITWLELLQHCGSVHHSVIIREDDVVELDLSKNVSKTHVLVCRNMDIFLVNIRLRKRQLIGTFWYLGECDVKNFNCQLIVVSDSTVYPFITLSKCNLYSAINVHSETVDTAHVTLDQNAQKAIIQFKIRQMLPKYSGLVKTCLKRLHDEDNIPELLNALYDCRNKHNGCIYACALSTEIKEHEKECVFDDMRSFRHCLCFLCYKKPFTNYKSIWPHYLNFHSGNIIPNNHRYVWSLSAPDRELFLCFMDHIFNLSLKTSNEKCQMSLLLHYQPCDLKEKFGFKITILDMTGNDQEMVITKPICKSPLVLYRDQMEHFLDDNHLHFIINIFSH